MKKNLFKNIMIYLLIVLGCVAVFQMMSGDRQNISELSSSEFMNNALAGEYSEVVIVASDNAWEVTATDEEENVYKATIPPQDNFVSQLDKKGVDVSFSQKAGEPWWQSILIML
ncbi:MAG: ATP-dependent metallopeptidase FtsH/Yme1/Tma family protein, partial [Clostridia bacterium]